MRARQLLQGLRASLYSLESRVFPVSWPNAEAGQQRAADHCRSLLGTCGQCSGPSNSAQTSSRARSCLSQLPLSQQNQQLLIRQHHAGAAATARWPASGCALPPSMQEAPGRSCFHTAAGRLSADAGSSPDQPQSRQPAQGMNPLQMVPGTVAAAQGSPAASVPQPAGDAAGGGQPRRARAIARNLKISPQKLNDFAVVVRRMHVQDAVLQCRYSVKKASTIVEKARACTYCRWSAAEARAARCCVCARCCCVPSTFQLPDGTCWRTVLKLSSP